MAATSSEQAWVAQSRTPPTLVTTTFATVERNQLDADEAEAAAAAAKDEEDSTRATSSKTPARVDKANQKPSVSFAADPATPKPAPAKG
ncbi:hypothetical protein N7481_001461 [Penicillium waksmanii]|uniref:uncharacterized protein n=1 Tax=Penicillium waksmanii TaxID=69791 RepID=UPI0025493082|nr:uncharacterized protein N7481_001461 [Penicillium waksmanii]KAJ6001052.1 hypothetical protein N7481_001461 [Penicillium waksmanii]